MLYKNLRFVRLWNAPALHISISVISTLEQGQQSLAGMFIKMFRMRSISSKGVNQQKSITEPYDSYSYHLKKIALGESLILTIQESLLSSHISHSHRTNPYSSERSPENSSISVEPPRTKLYLTRKMHVICFRLRLRCLAMPRRRTSEIVTHYSDNTSNIHVSYLEHFFNDIGIPHSNNLRKAVKMAGEKLRKVRKAAVLSFFRVSSANSKHALEKATRPASTNTLRR